MTFDDVSCLVQARKIKPYTFHAWRDEWVRGKEDQFGSLLKGEHMYIAPRQTMQIRLAAQRWVALPPGHLLALPRAK